MRGHNFWSDVGALIPPLVGGISMHFDSGHYCADVLVNRMAVLCRFSVHPRAVPISILHPWKVQRLAHKNLGDRIADTHSQQDDIGS